MSFKEVFQAHVVEHAGKRKIKMHAPDYFATMLTKVPIGKRVWVTVDDRAPRRSDQQNRLYWMYLKYIEDETGNDSETLHEHFKQKYLALPHSILALSGIDVHVTQYASTTGLSKAEFSEYLQKIERDTGIPIPDTEAYLYGAKEEQIEIYNKVMAGYPDNFEEPTI